ncbi:MAG: hypothetical protein GY861_27190 [bacterium]|nr:hypothetical protein [bacterium]
MFYLKIIILFLFISYHMHSSAVAVEYCRDVGTNLNQYTNKSEIYAELELEAHKRSAEYLFSKELTEIDYSVISVTKQHLIDVLVYLVSYDDVIKTAKGDKAFKPCVNLKNIRINSPKDKIRFSPIEIASFCYFDDAVVERKVSEIKLLFSNEIKNGKISNRIKNMLHTIENIQYKSIEELSQLIHLVQFELEKNQNVIGGTKCVSISIFPIELYAQSAPRKISAIIDMLPPIQVVDNSNKRGEFQIAIVHNQFHWKIGRWDMILKEGFGVVEDFDKRLSHPQFQNIIEENMRELISIGMASCEGRLKTENKRASKRSYRLVDLAKKAFAHNQDMEIYGLNLGKHRAKKKVCKKLAKKIRHSQRRLLLIGVTNSSDKNVVIKEALYNALVDISSTQPEILPIDPRAYHLFDVLK